jgi:hypothetical protein
MRLTRRWTAHAAPFRQSKRSQETATPPVSSASQNHSMAGRSLLREGSQKTVTEVTAGFLRNATECSRRTASVAPSPANTSPRSSGLVGSVGSVISAWASRPTLAQGTLNYEGEAFRPNGSWSMTLTVAEIL